jgi:serine/threonine protein kinase
MNERDILNKVDNDFIVRGVYTFQSKKYLYMVMEYMKGGDFGNLLENVHALNVETTKFYLAHVVLALEHLHSMGIVHRDLKPENMLIAADGHVKLTDFGLSEAGLRKKIQKTIMNKPKFKSKSEIFSINLDLAEQKLERNEITAKNLEIGLEKK